MIVSNGVRVGAAYKTVISGDGATVNSGNGRRLTSLNRWGMIWDGHHFAPPDSGCVLYYPGNPGMGSTITDFSRNFSNSGINTAEALDISELHIDVSGDPTSVISTGDVIRIEDELMLVTSSAEPILVLRGYEGSPAATHTNTKDIYVRTKNNGSITSATWRQLPSGLPYLSFDGASGDVTVPDTTSIQNIFDGGGTIECWINANSDGEGDEGVIVDKVKWSFYLAEDTGKVKVAFWCNFDGATNGTWITTSTEVTLNNWVHIILTYNSSATANDPIIYINGTVVALTESATPDGTRVTEAGSDLMMGNFTTDAATFDGGITLVRAYTTEKVIADAQLHHAEERHLFGV